MKYLDSENTLESWHREVLKLDWNNPNVPIRKLMTTRLNI